MENGVPVERPANLYEQLAGAITSLLSTPGPVVVGAAPRELHRPGLRARLRARPPAPATQAPPAPRSSLKERDIAHHTSVAITKITADAVATSEGLSNPHGSAPVNDHYRRHAAEGVYAIGVAVALPPATETPVPVNFPQTGHMTGQLADIAARDLAARLDRREGAATELSTHCLLAMGDRGAHMAVDPVRPPIQPQPRPLATQQLLDNTERPCQPLPPAKARLA